ncbi:MAG: hypothetical protein LBT24_01230 [Tannerella sp.]|jgi:hypothetical protein|nr:hypothetical protein [Tannerella sp.]
MKYNNIREESIKLKVGQDFFERYDCTDIKGFIDFAVKLKRPPSFGGEQEKAEYLLWAEVKQKPTDILVMLTQLVLTIGKARTFDKILPSPFLGCFDSEKIAFVPYSEIQNIFYQNDFNWNVTPSNTKTKEFQQVYAQIQKILNNDIPWETYLFDFEKDEKELRKFIKENFIVGKTDTTKIQIDKNNFVIIYNKWRETVQPTITANWDIAKKNGIIDGDFYLADLLSQENKTLKEKLFLLLKIDHYEIDRKLDEMGMFGFKTTSFKDSQKAHTSFWNKYKRPPKEEYWDYIVERRDLLVPQDVRERKGSFFTPQIWVELSQKYIADVLGKDWQDEYYVWDCAAGTGNLLAGLTKKYNVWASTLDKQDVDVMKDRIKNGANLLEDHVFQFDFLNDDFDKLPEGLKKIINNEEKRKKLVVYINPPYAETMSKTGTDKTGLNLSMVNKKYITKMGDCANRELFVQFLTRIYAEIPYATIANFSTLKNLQSPNFKNFRTYFSPKLEKLFIVPAYTFDNVKGQFPIGFMIWNTSIKEPFSSIVASVFDEHGTSLGTKEICCYDYVRFINEWIVKTRNRNNEKQLGFMSAKGNDFQNANYVYIKNDKKQLPAPRGSWVTDKNLIECCIYFSVRKCIEADWLNDRDQFLYPNDGWKTDTEFQNNCLAYTLFSNNIQSQYGTNHWIPFTEYQVAARDKFDSNFMTDFIAGKTPFIVSEPELFYFAAGNSGGGGYEQANYESKERKFSLEAKAVFKTGMELWRYYHSGNGTCPLVAYNVNASLYDIREHFQGRNEQGKMNNKSENETYMNLITDLRDKLKILAKKIEPKVYEYGFLKG